MFYLEQMISWYIDSKLQKRGLLNTFPYFSVKLPKTSIRTPKIINFPFVQNEKLMVFRCHSFKHSKVNMMWPFIKAI